MYKSVSHYVKAVLRRYLIFDWNGVSGRLEKYYVGLMGREVRWFLLTGVAASVGVISVTSWKMFMTSSAAWRARRQGRAIETLCCLACGSVGPVTSAHNLLNARDKLPSGTHGERMGPFLINVFYHLINCKANGIVAHLVSSQTDGKWWQHTF